MVETVDSPAKKTKAPKAKKPKTVPTHPKVSEMVNAAISSLKERGGSSLQAIKKYIKANYKVDAEKLSPFIKKYLKSSVVSGNLVQTKGKGATGSFRIGGAAGGKEKKSASKPKKAAVKAPKPKKPKTSSPKKTAKPKKAVAPKPKKSPVKKAKPATKKPAKPKAAATKAKKPKASPKKAAPKRGKK